MKKLLFFLAVMLAAPALTMKGQTYSSLWKQVEKAVNDDLPQTEQKLLRQIAAKAEQEKAYGQLLKAELQEVRALTDVSGDSLKPAIARLQAREQAAQEELLLRRYIPTDSISSVGSTAQSTGGIPQKMVKGARISFTA